MSVTLHDLSHDLGVEASRLIIELRAMGRSVRGPHSPLSDVVASRLRSRFVQSTKVVAGADGNPPLFGPVRREHTIARHVLGADMARTFNMLDIPNFEHGATADIDHVDLNRVREGLGLTVEKAAAIIGVSVDLLREVEARTATADATRAVLSRYGAFMSVWWSNEPLPLLAVLD